MMRVGRCALLWLLLSLALTGCWDVKDIQDINYLTAIGLDHVDHKYRVYVQMIDFTSVAKTETGKPTQQIPIWIGEGEGETLIGALNDLYRSSQLRIFYGQINTIVFSEKIMKIGLTDVKELLSRYYEIRYTPWVFGTKEPIDKLFAVHPFFNLSPLMSMLHQPQEIYKQQSIIKPLTLREFVADYREPGNTTLLPSLATAAASWKKDMEPKEMLTIDGVFAFHDRQYKEWIYWRNLPGLRWMEPSTNRSPILLRDGETIVAGIYLERPKVKITPYMRGNEASFTIKVEAEGYISEAFIQMSESALERKTAAQVRKQIKETYEEGLTYNLDLLRLEHALYRKKTRDWKRLQAQGGLHLTPDSLESINVTIKLEHSGKKKSK
ncbi:Ger(x)C family spore germination protein [Paenibacillus thermotolerans]|uniref:Ger(x)C family spore germination protein n=1 Tax=Paenibacillus thermotolerans TaxID=3027807 RepID=UPI002368B0BA|nr:MULTISPECIES: Ger(x)C family spore germination protein [unclassified Paenibacillus]